MPTILDVNFGREFFGWPETLEKRGRKICYQTSPSKFAEKFAVIFLKFAGPKQKNQPKSALHQVHPNILKRLLWKRLKGKNPEGKNFRKLLRRKQSSANVSKISRNTIKSSKVISSIF